jgi:hypothetical protein
MTTALEGVRGQRHAPAAVYSRESPGTHYTGGQLDPRFGLDRQGKFRPQREFFIINQKLHVLLATL